MASDDTYCSSADINPHVLGQRVLAARRASGLTQQQVCEAIGISRPTYIAVEKGERTPSPAELVKLASLFRRSLNEMLRQTEPIEQFVSHFRTASSEGSVELDEAVQLLESFVDNYLDLETKLKDPLTRRYPNVYSIEGLEITDAAEQVAESERNR